MNAIQRHIENARTACLDFVNSQFDELLTIVKANADFLDEMNATNAMHDPGADYDVAYIATPAEIPNDGELEKAAEQLQSTKAELEKRFDLEANPVENKKLIDPELWERLVKTFVIAGWNMRQLLDSKWWKEQTIEMSEKESKRLNELSLLRDQMILKEMDLAQVQGQNGITEIEKLAFTELAKKENLK